jgi:hypothetical protein
VVGVVAAPPAVKSPAQKRGELICLLEEALTVAEELEDGTTGYLIGHALDEVRSQQFEPKR